MKLRTNIMIFFVPYASIITHKRIKFGEKMVRKNKLSKLMVKEKAAAPLMEYKCMFNQHAVTQGFGTYSPIKLWI